MGRAAMSDTSHSWFLEKVSAAMHRVLLLDYDGTVAPFHADRLRAVPYPAVPHLLRRIMTGCNTRVIMISGRAAHEIPPLLGIRPSPEIWGTHGLQRLHVDGRLEETEVDADALHTLAQAESDLGRENLGHLLEITPAGIAVHSRGQPPAEHLKIRARVYGVLQPLATHPGLVLSEFDAGIEIRLRSASKGNALNSLLSQVDAQTAVAYLGNDTTDEEAFRALNGRGLSVLVRRTPRFTAAQLWLRPPEELIHFLQDWIHASQGDV